MVVNRLKWIVCVVALSVSVGVSAEDVDPWESTNRKIFAFNDVIDKYLLKPVTVGFKAVTPDFLEDGIRNFFYNASEILTIVNALAQGKFAQSGQDTVRFFVNSTVGIAGLIDVSTRIGLERNNEDFSQTLAFWGVSEGPYLVLPILGPSTVRDAATYYPDSSFTMLNTLDHAPTRWQLYMLGVIDLRAKLLDAEVLIVGDRYTFIRDAYLQRRKFLSSDGEVSDEDLFDDGFDDEDFDDDFEDEDYDEEESFD